MIMNAGLAAAALAGLSSCTNYSEPYRRRAICSSASGGSGGAAGPTRPPRRQTYPVGSGKIFPDAADRDHPAEGR